MLAHPESRENTPLKSIAKNNEGVNFIMCQDFESAIQCFQEALVSYKIELVTLNRDFPGNSPRPGLTRSTVPLEIVRTKPTYTMAQEDVSDTFSCLKAHLSPIRLLHQSFDNKEIVLASQWEACRNLSIAVTVLNAAISNHLLFLQGEQHGTISHGEQQTRRTKTRSLYDKVIQILMNSDPQDPEVKHLEAAFDLALLVALNNSLVLEEFNKDIGNGDGKEGNVTERIQLLAHAICCCSSKVYSSEDCISRALSEFQEASMTNILVMKALKPMSAAAA